jgi:hypothetical protein
LSPINSVSRYERDESLELAGRLELDVLDKDQRHFRVGEPDTAEFAGQLCADGVEVDLVGCQNAAPAADQR